MGHEIIKCPITPSAKQFSRKQFPSIDELSDCDRIIVSGPEHLSKVIWSLYPDWNAIGTKKIGWLHETVERSDYGRLPIEDIRTLFDIGFTPACQDRKHGLDWLPFGVDTEVFRPSDLPKRFNVGFIGLLYGPRAEFVKKSCVEFRYAQVNAANGKDSHDVEWSALLLAESYRQFRVMLNLPSLCRHTVTKVYEILACGTALVTPILADKDAFENFSIFKNGAHLQYYAENPKGIIQQLLNEPEYREQMAKQGLEYVHKEHNLAKRCEVLLAA